MKTPDGAYDGGWISPEDLGQNETYVGNRLVYNRSDQTETTIFDFVTGSEAKRILFRAFVPPLVLILLSSLSDLVSSSSKSSGSSAGAFGLIVGLIWMAVNLFGVRRTVLGDWNMLLHKKSEFADTAYAAVFKSLRDDHKLPDTMRITVRRVRVGPPLRGVRNLLEVSLGKYSVYVSVFAFGADLYVGWTLWRRQSAMSIVWRWLSTRFSDPTFFGMIEVEPVKAMRDAVHDGLRTGIEAAMLGKQIPLTATFGSEPPIESMDAGPAETTTARWLTVEQEVPVYSVADGSLGGYAQPGMSYEVLSEGAGEMVVRDASGSVAVLRDATAVRWS